MTVYFPGNNEIWYDKDTFQEVKTNGPKTISVVADRVRKKSPLVGIETDPVWWKIIKAFVLYVDSSVYQRG